MEWEQIDVILGILNSLQQMDRFGDMLEGLEAAHIKLGDYFKREQGSLGHLYGIAQLLNPCKNDQIFQGSNWQVEDDETFWADSYSINSATIHTA